MDKIITTSVGTARACPAAQPSHRNRASLNRRNHRPIRPLRFPGAGWRVALISTVCALSACGGSDPSTPPAVAANPPVVASSASVPVVASAPVTASAPSAASAPVMASAPVVTVLVFGDDGMMGIQSVINFAPIVTQNTEPVQTQAILQSQFEDTGIAVIDKASGGTASNLPDLLAGSDGGGPPLADRIAAANIVVEEHGLNEIYESVPDYTADLTQWLQVVRSSGAIPVLEETSPSCNSNEINDPQYVQAMDDFAAANGVLLISQYAAIQALPDWQSHLGNCEFPDDYLTSFRAQREADALAPLIKTIAGK